MLKNDHEEVRALFRRYEQAGERAYTEKRRIVDRIIEELSRHAAIEEQVFYPTARANVPDTGDTTLESIEEHRLVKWQLEDLRRTDPREEAFDPKVAVLIEMVRHHVDEEESELFPAVRKAMGRNDLAELGEVMAEARRTAPTKPHPRMPDVPPFNAVAGVAAGAADRLGDTAKGVAQGAVSAVKGAVSVITRSGDQDGSGSHSGSGNKGSSGRSTSRSRSAKSPTKRSG